MKRAMAQLIDFVLGILMLFLIFGFVLPWIQPLIPNDIIRTLIGMFLIGLLYFFIQYPFMQNGQTIGKGFYRLKIVSTDKFRKDISVAVVFQREILCKLMSCYFICIPLLAGKVGGHEEATHTKIVQV
ncbi:RDD family protein [Enterococcus aquimarinus]|nr:RDD family protein [Enterococcus aquimarinus]